MPGKPGYDALRPARTGLLPTTSSAEQHKAVQRTLRAATRDAWPRTDIQDVLEMLGLADPSELVLIPTPEPAPEPTPEPKPVKSTASRDREWCRRELHRMAGGNVYTDPNGYRECRKCKQASRSGADPATMHPAEPGSPKFIPGTPMSRTAQLKQPGDDQWCKRGLHLLLGDNVVLDKKGKRECRDCRNWRRRRERARKSGKPFEESPT